MSIKFFGQFLLERKALTSEQLLDAISYQETHNLKFGQYAMKKGYLKPGDVDRLNEEQKRSDNLIGELAVKLGMLEPSHVEEILTMQKNDHVQIGQVIVTKGFLTEEQLQVELEAFKADQSVYATGNIVVPEGIKSSELVGDIVDITVKMLQRVAGVEAKVDDGNIVDQDPEQAFSAVSITFSGGMNCDYILMSDEDGAKAMTAAVIGQDASDEAPEVLVDGIKEFANVVCGNILARMAQKGKSVEISIPHVMQYNDGYGVINGRKAVIYKIPTTGGMVSLLLVLY